MASGKQTLSAKEEETYAQLDAARAQLTESSKQAAETEAALEAQAQEVIQAYGEAWPAEAWDAYVQAAVEAYLPVARAVVAEQDASQAQAAVPGLVADSQSAFWRRCSNPQPISWYSLQWDWEMCGRQSRRSARHRRSWIRQNRRHGSSLMRHGTN